MNTEGSASSLPKPPGCPRVSVPASLPDSTSAPRPLVLFLKQRSGWELGRELGAEGGGRGGDAGGEGWQFNFQSWSRQFRLCRDKKAISAMGF